MKNYNIINYVRYKNDLASTIDRSNKKNPESRDRYDIIVRFMPLVENIARKFSTAQQASGVMTINDLIQEGNYGLIMAVDKIDWERVDESDYPDKTIMSFLSKRIKGGIRRGIDRNRGDIRIPEHKINQIRKDNGRDKEMVAMFFNSIFLSVDEQLQYNNDTIYQIPDNPECYNLELLNTYLMSLLKKHLNDREYEVLRLSYGLNCDKHSAKQVAEKLGIFVDTANVRVSQIKRDAIDKLINNVDKSQILDYL
jgi:RNA polymerase sigma factor (sigma-70 family)